jgi:hypothetical protein
MEVIVRRGGSRREWAKAIRLCGSGGVTMCVRRYAAGSRKNNKEEEEEEELSGVGVL